jgi:5-methyltetrahydrofolate--homocysteine methyltransferase
MTMSKEQLLEKIRQNVLQGRVDEMDEGFEGDMEGQPGVTELVQQALDENIPVNEILGEALSPAMEEVGRMYEAGDYLIPDMLASAECVSGAMDVLDPHLAESGVEHKGKIIIATVEGDLHDIGKNIVITLLKGAGYEVTDMGTSVPADKIVALAKEQGAQFIGLSALLTSTMDKMRDVIEAFEAANARGDVKIIVGGAPVTEDFAKQIGADAYCRDAFDAIEELASLKA